MVAQLGSRDPGLLIRTSATYANQPAELVACYMKHEPTNGLVAFVDGQSRLVTAH